MDHSFVVKQQYGRSDRLKIRMETHRLYEEKKVKLAEEAKKAMQLNGNESIVDVGCGTGDFLHFLREYGHLGRLVGVDQSSAMIEETSRKGIEAIVGDAQQLPLDDGRFDWVCASHMLYHVPDIPKALSEFKRVSATSGATIAITNSKRSLPMIMDLYSEMLTAFGYSEFSFSSSPFCIENAPELLRSAYADVQEHIITNALVFHESEPIVNYIETMFNLMNIPDESEIHLIMKAWLREHANLKLQKFGGVWRDHKNLGIYVCSS